MSKHQNLILEADNSLLENNLRFVKNEFEEEFQSFIKNEKNKQIQNAPFKMVLPTPGICVKSYKVGTQDKFFINICHTKEIPAPKDITESELQKLLEEQVISDFKVPLSITKPRETTDKSGNKVEVSDVAVNTEFFKKKVKDGGLFFQFVITLIFESIENKYQIEIDSERFVVLKNRPFIGQLVEHQIYSRDVNTVHQYYDRGDINNTESTDETTTETDGLVLPGANTSVKSAKPLIQEIPSISTSTNKNTQPKSKVPEYRLIEDVNLNKQKFFEAEFYLPGVASLAEIDLQITDDRIYFDASKIGYSFEGFLKNNISTEKTKAEYDFERMILKVHMPISV